MWSRWNNDEIVPEFLKQDFMYGVIHGSPALSLYVIIGLNEKLKSFI